MLSLNKSNSPVQLDDDDAIFSKRLKGVRNVERKESVKSAESVGSIGSIKDTKVYPNRYRDLLFEGSSEDEVEIDEYDPLIFDRITEEIEEELEELIGKGKKSDPRPDDVDRVDTRGFASIERSDTLPEGIEHSQSFSKNGKQGVVGLFKLKSGKRCVWKISQHLNYIVDQENTILNSLNDMREYCPHFVRGFGKLNIKINSDYRKVENPFKISGRHNIYNDVLLLEHVNEGRKLYRYLKNKNIEEDVLYSIIKQTLLAITIAEKNKGLTHYDLHSNNILVKTCNPNSVFLYVLDEKKQYCVPTYGYYPVIIDFGFGYVKNMDGGPLWGSLAHTDVGFLCNMCDKWADPKLFLVTISDELKGYKNSKTSKKFRRLVKNIFEPLSIDWESGWDNRDGLINCSDKIYNVVKREGKFSRFFKESGHYCIDIMQSLITLPIKKRRYNDIEDVYRMIVDEFHKIEMEISSVFYNLYIFREIVNSARLVKDMYSKRETMTEATRMFKNNCLNTISTVAKYCNPKLDWDKLLCSLIVFSRKMEGMIYEHMSPIIKEKNEEYMDMEVKTQEEIYEAIEVNIPGHFVFDKETKVYVWDSYKKQSNVMVLSQRYVDKLNKEQNTLHRGGILYNFYKNM